MTETIATRAIVVERTLPYPPKKIWRTLTDPALISQWLMPNDFQPVVGHRFNFRTKPQGDWDGVVDCEVLEIKPHRLLRYSWKGGSKTNPKYGSQLDTVVTWTLTPVDGGTHVHMKHEGFKPENSFAYNAMSPGWSHVLERIEHMTATLE